MLRHPAFPNVPSSERVGPIDGRRFMESLSEHTLACMAKGKAGEPVNVIALAKSILFNRGLEGGAPKRPDSVKSKEDQELFDRMLEHASTAKGPTRHSAITLLQNYFGYNFHKDNKRPSLLG